MNLRNVLWIWRREMRDQFRDRRTLFMVAVLPVLMYPLLGTSMFQLAQFMRETVGRVVLVGVEELDGVEGLPPLVEDESFAAGLFATPEAAGRLTIVGPPKEDGEGDRVAAGKATIADGDAEVAVCFPEGFGAQLAELRAGLVEGVDEEVSLGEIQSALGRLSVLFNAAREPSQVAGLRVEQVLSRWRQAVIQENLAAGNVPISVTSPFQVSRIDVAPKESRDALLWSKLLPFIVFIWALTGAFYPAIDLCAGEKERGTLETLLASPARRSEIVGGKLLTVMTFSIFTACLNLASLALTAKVLMNQLTGVLGGAAAVAPPSAAAIFWILVALVPIGALFSALSLACAAYARSTKEGQYYFMPLFLAATPLMLVPMSPGVELNLGNSLVPVMGLVLLLRAMIEGQLATAALYAGPVVAVTAVCCWLAMRWAVSQFNQESVLFRESERFDLRGQLRAMVRRRGETPSAAAAMACVGGVFLVQFVVRSILPWLQPESPGFGYLATTIVVSQVACIAAPALIVAGLLARNWRKTFLLAGPPRLGTVGLAVGMAAALHPVGQRLALWIRQLYPLSADVEAQLAGFGSLMGEAPPLWAILLLLAALPAICEELAFRGVVLSGLRKSLGDFGGVLMTAVLFGATHTVLQQSLAAAPIGVVIGLIALRTGSLWPCIAFHAAYNALQLLAAFHAEGIRSVTEGGRLGGLVFTEIAPGELGYAAPIVILGCVVAVVLWRAIGRPGCGQPQPSSRWQAAS